MNFSEILSLFNQGKGTARSHMKNLIEMAAADGNFDDVEYHLLAEIAVRNGISASQLKEIKNNPDKVTFVVPKDPKEKFIQLYDLVHMMSIDNEIHEEETKLSILFAIKFGYPRIHVKELIDTIRQNISFNQSYDETMKRCRLLIG